MDTWRSRRVKTESEHELRLMEGMPRLFQVIANFIARSRLPERNTPF